MNILGISGAIRRGNHDAAAVLVRDGKVIAAAEEERFLGIKHAPGVLPKMAIEFCLKKSGLALGDIDLVVFPGRTYKDMETILRRYFKLNFGSSPRIELIDHHLAHAASAYFTSGLNGSLIITADLSGDSRSTVLFYGSNGKIKEVRQFPKPNSLGIFYALITQYIGFRYNNDECKVMALSGYGRPNIDLSWLLKFKGCNYELSPRYIDSRVKPGFSNPSLQEPLFTEAFTKKIGHKPHMRGFRMTQFYRNFAASGQNLLERVYFDLLSSLQAQFQSASLCLAGGVALNAELNRKLLYSGRLKEIFVQPVANDAGLALGGALFHSAKNGELRPRSLRHIFLGPQYNDGDIKYFLDRLGIKYVYSKNIEEKIAQALSRGKIVAVFNGRMEYGPRALGNRSILADPRDAKVKMKINRWIKNREGFQPFGPAVVEEAVPRFFELPDCSANLEFMVINLKVKNGTKRVIPAVVHINGTSRVQVVKKSTSAAFYKVIDIFGQYTGVPVLLNTSLNVRGQPIARTPQDAISVFATTPIDFLALGNFWVKKKC